MITSDPKHPGINVPTESGQNEAYLVLSDEELAKGFIRPVRTKYIHKGVRPNYPTRELTPEEHNLYAGQNYVAFEKYPKGKSAAIGRFWTKSQLDSSCGGLTTMGLAIAETYARDNRFYSETFCCHCGKHFDIREFVWEDNTLVGS